MTAESPELKYLAIKNWGKYQVDREGNVLEGPSPWIKDWTDKEADYDYSKLTVYQRYVYDGLRRLCGKHGRYPHNDPTYIARALDILPRERGHVAQALQTLTARGLITPVESADLPRKSKSKNKKEETEVEGRNPLSTATSSESELLTENNPVQDVESAIEVTDAERIILERFSELSGKNLTLLVNNSEVVRQAHLLAEQHKPEHVVAVMETTMTDGWWADKINSFPFFYEKFDEHLIPEYTKIQRGKKALAGKKRDGEEDTPEYRKDTTKFI